METNENTIHMDEQEKEQSKKETQSTRDGDLWKKVSFGTAAGILLGAGTIYAVDHIGGEEEASVRQDVHTDSQGPQPPIYNHAPVAHVSDSMSFSQAFAAARAQVGAGGVFSWHGGIYGTYYETEWNAMSPAQRAAYAHSVNPEVRAQHVDTTHVSENHPDVAVNTHSRTTGGQRDSGGEHQQHEDNPNGNQAGLNDNNHNDNHNDNNNGQTRNTGGGQQQERQFLDDEDDVHVLARSNVQGHEAVAVDVTGDNQPDAIIIDVDDNKILSNPDVVVLRDGRQGTVAELGQAQRGGSIDTDVAGDTDNINDYTEDPAVSQASIENPDVSPGMPDYMDDANIPV